MSEQWTWRVVDEDGNVLESSDEPIVMRSTTQLGEKFGLTEDEEE